MKKYNPDLEAARHAGRQRDEAMNRARSTQLKAERLMCDKINGFSIDREKPVTQREVDAAWREHEEAIKDLAHWSERERIHWNNVERVV